MLHLNHSGDGSQSPSHLYTFVGFGNRCGRMQIEIRAAVVRGKEPGDSTSHMIMLQACRPGD